MEAAFFSLIEKLRTQAPRNVDVIGLGECSLDLIYPLSGRLRDCVGGKGAATAKGTGLGLAILKDYIALHRGTVSLVPPDEEADSSFGGAHFRLTLPRPQNA